MTLAETAVFKTGDLAEASVISMHGLTPAFEQNGKRCVFVFALRPEDDAEFFQELLDDLRASKCRVEPKRFARELKHVREAMYDFMRVDRGSRRLRTD